jgi:hypothetical protein
LGSRDDIGVRAITDAANLQQDITTTLERIDGLSKRIANAQLPTDEKGFVRNFAVHQRVQNNMRALLATFLQERYAELRLITGELSKLREPRAESASAPARAAGSAASREESGGDSAFLQPRFVDTSPEETPSHHHAMPVAAAEHAAVSIAPISLPPEALELLESRKFLQASLEDARRGANSVAMMEISKALRDVDTLLAPFGIRPR